MGFPRKFKELLEIELADVDAPEVAWLTYAVCATEKGSCGWGGWMLEAALKGRGENGEFNSLSACNEQTCPRCGRETFRTGATLKFIPSTDQVSHIGIPGVDYDVLPIEYDDDEV